MRCSTSAGRGARPDRGPLARITARIGDAERHRPAVDRVAHSFPLIASNLGVGQTDAEIPGAVLCQVGLPRSRTPERTFERSTGHASMMIEAGGLWTRRGWVDKPLPYGVKPRLVLLHVCAEAIRAKCPEIGIGRSAREFLTRLGINNGGREYAQFRAQMESLAACKMKLGTSIGERDFTIDTSPIRRFDAWMQHDDKSLGLWPGSLTLSEEFFRTLPRRHDWTTGGGSRLPFPSRRIKRLGLGRAVCVSGPPVCGVGRLTASFGVEEIQDGSVQNSGAPSRDVGKLPASFGLGRLTASRQGPPPRPVAPLEGPLEARSGRAV